ncbi:MAG: DUF2797 domain-containing protein [Gammaproteobacteria bacterium]|nr:DUF2797 domain-containing protein [Gammaproteobacteria bacterium]
MLEVSGSLRKLHTKLDSQNSQNTVEYSFDLDKKLYQVHHVQDIILNIEYLGEIFCISCQAKTKKSFNQGYCFPCFRKLASCDLCILSPERCHFHLGTCREPEWAMQHCMDDHVVYIANSSGLKVGITRASQLPTRWIDQGAIQALVIARVSSRYQAGLLEIICKKHLKDRTDWRVMLKTDADKVDKINLYQARDDLYEKIFDEFKQLQEKFLNSKLEWCADGSGSSELVTEICYPVREYPNKIVSLNLDTNPSIHGKLLGIKGQYLILDSGVINIRKYTGYQVKLTMSTL